MAAAHPAGTGFGLVAAGAVALSARATWRQATGRGLSLPGTDGTLRIETAPKHGEREQWAMTVSITEN